MSYRIDWGQNRIHLAQDMFHSNAEAVMALTTQPHPKTDVKERVEL
jgi:hypothetical protein